MSTNNQTPARLARIAQALSHGDRISLIAALLAEGFSPETKRQTLKALKEYDLTPVQIFDVEVRCEGWNGEEGPELEDSRDTETIRVECAQPDDDDTEFAAVEEAIEKAVDEYHRETGTFRRGWRYKISPLTVRRFDPYTFALGGVNNAPPNSYTKEFTGEAYFSGPDDYSTDYREPGTVAAFRDSAGLRDPQGV